MSRILYIDISKSLAIILMVIGHTSIPIGLSNWIWSFHMPFFFIVSGMMTNWHREKADFEKTKTRSLLFPFFYYSIFNLVIFYIIDKLREADFQYYVLDVLKHGWGGVALWFIPVLWIALLCSKFILDYGNRWITYAFIALFSIIGTGLCFKQISLPWTLSTVPIACVYVLLGSSLRNKVEKINGWSISTSFLIGILGLIVTLIISHYFRQDLAANKILPFFPLLIASLCGFMMLLAVSVLISKWGGFLSSLLSKVGKNTLEVMALSQCLIGLLNLYIPHLILLKYFIMALLISGVVYIKHKYKSYRK